MNLLISAINIFAISIVVFAFINLKLSIALYASFLILVPFFFIEVAGILLPFYLVVILLLVVFLYHFRLKKKINLSYKVNSPFLFLYLSLLLLSILSWSTSGEIQLLYWLYSLIYSFFLSFILWNMALKDPKILIYFKWTIIISITISGIYGLFLTQMGGLNPYTVFMSGYFDRFDVSSVNADRESRLSFSSAAKINSTMESPFTWTLLLCFLMTIFTSYYLKTKIKAYWFFIGLIGFNILIAGVRTGIAALVIGYIYFLIRFRQFKLILSTLLLISILAVVVQSNDDLSNLFGSFTDISGTESTVKGSSISMRLNQLEGAIHEIKGVELVGKGYGWCWNYTKQHRGRGGHPILLGFESLVFVALCDSGFIGVLIWIIFFILLFRLQRNILKTKQDVMLMDSFVIVFAAYTVGTGDNNYIQIFSFYYTYLLAYLLNNQKLVSYQPSFYFS